MGGSPPQQEASGPSLAEVQSKIDVLQKRLDEDYTMGGAQKRMLRKELNGFLVQRNKMRR